MDSDSVSEDAEDEGPTTEDEDHAAGDKGLTARVEGLDMDDRNYGLVDETHGMDDESRGIDDEGHSVESDGLSLEEDDEVVPRGQQQTALVVRTVVTTPLGLGYEALRHRELALEEDDVYSKFEIRQGSGSTPESERPERVSASRQSTLATWIDLEDGIVYIHVSTYPPPAPPAQTPPLPDWTSGSLPISPSPSVVPSPFSSPLTVSSPVATPATVETEGFLTDLGAQVEMQEGLIYDHALRLEELSPSLFERYDSVSPGVMGRRTRLELAEVVNGMRKGQEPRGDA
ncbi:hypothetical protein Tco_1171403 [Tanacetum coccineum]